MNENNEKSAEKAQIWSAYWLQGGNSVSCLPGAPEALGNLLNGIWREFARSLDPGSSVVDLACGRGAVGGAMLEASSSIEVIGVDFAPLAIGKEPPYPVLIESIEETSIDAESLDAAVSQFGVEYSDPSKSGKELARILKPGAKFQFVMHYAGSVIVQANEARAQLLSAVDSESIWKAAGERDVNALQKAFDAIHTKYGETPLFLELASAVRAVIGHDDTERAEILGDLRTSIEFELGIIESLKSAAIGPDEFEKWTAKFGKKFKFEEPTVIRIGDDIICWNIVGAFQP